MAGNNSRLVAKPPSHPSVTALLAEALPGESAKEVMIRKCRDLISWARNKGWKGSPYFDPEILASLLGIKVVTKPATLDIGGEAALISVRGRLEIWVKDGVTSERRRFSIFHEIAHTCFQNSYGKRQNHLAPGPLSAEEREFETLCDIGASELLFPLSEFGVEFAARPFSGESLLSLARYFWASEESSIRRIIEQRFWLGAALLLIENDAPSSKCGLKIKYSIKHPDFGPAPWSNNSVPVKCAAYQCIKSLKIEKQSSLYWHVGGKMRCYKAEALPLPIINVIDAPKALVLLQAK